jgi:predicted nucleotidyltransferase
MINLFNIDFIDFLELLDKHKVEYLLVGGYAVVLHGYNRSTGDMDIWVHKSEENYNKLQNVYSDFAASMFSKDDFLSNDFNVWSMGKEPVKIEIITDIIGLVFQTSIENCKWYELNNIKVPFIDLEDLIKTKKASGRYKDLADIEQLKKLKKNQ